MLRILQVNCQKSLGAMCDLGDSLLRHGVQVCLLQEPCTFMNGVRGLPSTIRSFVSESCQAAICILDNEYECMLVEEGKHPDGVCIYSKGPIGELYLVSLYCPPNGRIEEATEYIEGLLSITRGKPILVGMDANATSDLWSSKPRGRNWSNSRRGRVLTEWLSSQDIDILNTPSAHYTFSGARGSSDIDLTLMSAPYLTATWEVKPGWTISDHNALLIELSSTCTSENLNPLNRWNQNDCNWMGYKGLLESLSQSYDLPAFQSLSLSTKSDLIYDWIDQSNVYFMKRARCPRRASRVKWWSMELENLKRATMQARRRYQASRRRDGDPNRTLWLDWKAKTRAYKSAMKLAKSSNWQEFVSKESQRDPWGIVYKFCMGKLAKTELTSLKIDGVWTSTWVDTANALLQEFFPEDRSGGKHSVPDPIVYNLTSLSEFTSEELNNAIFKMSRGRAPGLDGVSNEMIKCLWHSAHKYLLELYNSCLREGKFLTQWKRARVITLLKSPDKERTHPRSYRPISLLSGLGKILERLLVGRLMSLMNGRWNLAQYGFVEGRCTEDAWLRLKAHVSDATGKYAIGVFVDFKGAFDYLRWEVILDKIGSVGCPAPELNLWRDYFKDRSVLMTNGVSTVDRRVSRGCPQGSICGPILWNLCLDDLLHDLSAHGTKVVAYADDLLLVVEGNTRAEVERRVAETMLPVYAWGERVGVEVSEGKTVCMVLKGELEMLNRRITIPIGNDTKRLKFVDKTKYLGVTVQPGLTFKLHVIELGKKVEGIVGKLRRVLRKDWGLRKSTTSIVLRGLLNPAVMYASIVWYDILRLKGFRTRLNRYQRIALYASTRTCRTVSTEAMQVLDGSLPWDIECMLRACLYKIRKDLPMEGLDLNLASNEDLQGLSLQEKKTKLHDSAYDFWQTRWDASEKGRVTYQWIRDVRFSSITPHFTPGLNLTFILTGHGSLNEFLYRRALSDNPSCICGEGPEDWVHLLCECNMYAAFRDLDELGITKAGNKWFVRNSLKSRGTYSRLCAFINRAYKMRASIISRIIPG